MENLYQNALRVLDSWAKNPTGGLPEDLFVFIGRLTPLVNVDLLIEDREGRLLLTWRSDEIDTGWHIPGGIIRYKETAEDRIRATARTELGMDVDFETQPISVEQVIHPSRRERGHFVSLAYRCRAVSPPAEALRYRSGVPQPGQWAWHAVCPSDLLAVHDMYRQWFNSEHRPRAAEREIEL